MLHQNNKITAHTDKCASLNEKKKNIHFSFIWHSFII